MRPLVLVAVGLVALACKREAPPPPPPAPAPAPVPAPLPAVSPPAVPKQPVTAAPTRGTTNDTDLRVMLSELASAKACGLIRGGFNGLRAVDDPDVVTGVLWIRECDITNAGLHVTFHITGSGWLWVDQTKKKGGGTFVVRQYVRFSVATTIRGALDLAYDRDHHVASVWFTPDQAPEVTFATVGDVDVDRENVWSSLVGALGTVFSTSPEDAATAQANLQGTKELAAQLANGLSVTLDLCTGLLRVQLGRTVKGQMVPADVGETQRVPVEIQPGGVMIIGPQLAQDGMTVQVDPASGGVRLALMCAKQADRVATEFMAGRTIPPVPVLATVDVRAASKLRLKPTACPVVVVARPLDAAPARFAWERPTSEVAHSAGGPLIHCQPVATVKPKAPTRAGHAGK